MCGDPRIFGDLTKVPQVFRNPGGSPLLKIAHWLLVSDRPLANARGSVGYPLESRIMLPSRDREGVVADSFSTPSVLKMVHWPSHVPIFMVRL